MRQDNVTSVLPNPTITRYKLTCHSFASFRRGEDLSELTNVLAIPYIPFTLSGNKARLHRFLTQGLLDSRHGRNILFIDI